jgi:hypothetical protein
VWEGFLVFVFLTTPAEQKGAVSILMLVVFMAFGLFAWVGFLGMPDRVEDHGGYLVVQRYRARETIPIANIKSVTKSYGARSYNVLIELSKPCAFGKEIEFKPQRWRRFTPFGGGEDIVEQLADRVESAQRLARSKV